MITIKPRNRKILKLDKIIDIVPLFYRIFNSDMLEYFYNI